MTDTTTYTGTSDEGGPTFVEAHLPLDWRSQLGDYARRLGASTHHVDGALDLVRDWIRAASGETPDETPIPALLPRDWPRQVQRLCDDLHASPAARRAANELVDSWVLAATDATTDA